MHNFLILSYFLGSLGLIFLINRVFRSKFSEAPFLYCSVVSLTLYFFGLFDQLDVGVYLLLISGCAYLIYLVFYLKSIRRLQFNKHKVAYVSVIFLCFCWIFRIVPRNFLITGWDEFSFWASSAKLIVHYKTLYKEDWPINFKSYPPAQQVFQYFFLNLTGWNERVLLRAENLFITSGLLAISGAFFTRKYFLTVLSFIMSFGILYAFNFNLGSLYADSALGVWFAACLAFSYGYRKNFKDFLKLAIASSVLVLLKPTGIVFFAAILLCFFLKNFKNFKTLLTDQIPTLILTGVGGFVFMSWHVYGKTINVVSGMPNTSDMLSRYLTFDVRLGQTFAEFFKRIKDIPYTAIRFPTVIQDFNTFTSMFIICIIFTFLVFRGIRQKKHLFKIGPIIGFVGYVVFLMLAYLFIFGDYEGVRLGSFERYSSTYFLGWSLFLLPMAYKSIERLSQKNKKTAVIVFTIVLAFLIPQTVYRDLKKIQSAPALLAVREKVSLLSAPILATAAAKEKTYFISQNSTGFEKYVFNYTMLPLPSLWWCWSVGKPYNAEDIWTCPKPLAELLEGYDYLVLYNADEQFWRDNGNYFEAADQGLSSGTFKISRLEGQIKSMKNIGPKF